MLLSNAQQCFLNVCARYPSCVLSKYSSPRVFQDTSLPRQGNPRSTCCSLAVWSVVLRDSWTWLGPLDIRRAFLLPGSWLLASFLLGLYSKLALTGVSALMTLSEIVPSLILRKPASILYSASSVLSLSHMFCICLFVLFPFSTPHDGRFRKGRDFVYYWTPVPRTVLGAEQVLSIYLLGF